VTKKVRVQLFGHQRRGIDVDADATDGSVIGENLFLPDGTLVTQQMIVNNFTTVIGPGGPITASPTLWELILNIPAIIQAIVALATNGFMVVTDYTTGTIESRAIQGEIGRIDVADGDGIAGDPIITLGDWPTVRNRISTGESYTIQPEHQLLVYDEFLFDGGDLTIDGELVIL